MERVRSSAIKRGEQDGDERDADADERGLLQRVGFRLGVGHDALRELVADRGDSGHGLGELRRVERHEGAAVGGDDDAVQAVHRIVQTAGPSAFTELRQPGVGSDVLELVDEGDHRVAEQGGLNDACGVARCRPVADRLHDVVGGLLGRGQGGDRQQGSAELGVAGLGGQQSAEADQLTLGRVVCPHGGDHLEVVTGVDRDAARAQGAGDGADLDDHGVAVADVAHDLTQIAHGTVGGAPRVADGGGVIGSGRALFGLDRLDRRDERLPRGAQLGATPGLGDIVEVATDRQREKRADGHQQWQCGDEQF